MPLSSANALQAKTGNVTATTAPVVLDAGTQAGSTVMVELAAGGVPLMDGGLQGRIPNGFEFDGVMTNAGLRYLHIFRKRDVAAGEGVAGSTSWDFSYVAATPWTWRVTEWDRGLEPIFPLEAPVVSGFASGTAPTSLSTGTTQQTSRSDVVCLAWHYWDGNSQPTATMNWSGHTNGFTERDELRWTSGAFEIGSSWSWLFSQTTGPFECTATINKNPRDASDNFVAMLVVYAATTYA